MSSSRTTVGQHLRFYPLILILALLQYRYMAKYIMVRASKSGLAVELALALRPVAIELKFIVVIYLST